MTDGTLAVLETEIVPASAQPLDQNPAAVFLAGLSNGSKPTMKGALDKMAHLITDGQRDGLSMPWGELRFSHVQAIRAKLMEMHSPAMVNKVLSALRGVLHAAWQLKQIPTEEYHRAIDFKGVKGSTLPAGRALNAGEIKALFETIRADRNPAKAARDAALIAVLYAGGLRRAELVSLDIKDYDAAQGVLSIRRGKGQKARTVPVVNGMKDALDDWLSARTVTDEEQPIFVPVRRSGTIAYDKRLTPTAIFEIVEKRRIESGLKKMSPHDLRRTFVGDLLEGGADISTVQQMAGHANVSTTQRYDRRGEAIKAKAAGLIYVPYEREAATEAEEVQA